MGVARRLWSLPTPMAIRRCSTNRFTATSRARNGWRGAIWAYSRLNSPKTSDLRHSGRVDELREVFRRRRRHVEVLCGRFPGHFHPHLVAQEERLSDQVRGGRVPVEPIDPDDERPTGCGGTVVPSVIDAILDFREPALTGVSLRRVGQEENPPPRKRLSVESHLARQVVRLVIGLRAAEREDARDQGTTVDRLRAHQVPPRPLSLLVS